jgi:hypothetical protein
MLSKLPPSLGRWGRGAARRGEVAKSRKRHRYLSALDEKLMSFAAGEGLTFIGLVQALDQLSMLVERFTLRPASFQRQRPRCRPGSEAGDSRVNARRGR